MIFEGSEMEYQFRSLEQWPVDRTKNRTQSRFKAGYSDTMRLLERELDFLRAKNVVIQADCGPEMIRRDGMLRSGAMLRGPGIILSFESKHGELSYPCDTYTHWECNIRAIAISLEALRTVDRYGVTRRAEQYKGWDRIEGPTKPSTSNVEDAALLLAKYHVVPFRDILKSRGIFEAAYRVAATKTHPDAGGSVDEFKRVQAAKELLDKHFGDTAA